MKDRHNNELIYLYHQGNEWAYEELLRRATGIIFKTVNQFLAQKYNSSLERSECIQIGYISFQQSLDYYCESKDATFSTYFYAMLKYTLMNYRHRQLKHKQREITFDYLEDYEEYHLSSNYQHYCYEPNKMLGYHYVLEDLEKLANETTGLERQVILCMLNGEDSKEMSRHLDIDRRQINNALYRIRKKLRIIHQ